MAEFQAGEVVVPVVPSAQGFIKDLKKQIVPGAYGVGQDIGGEVQRGIQSSLKKISVPVDADTSAARASIEGLAREAQRVSGQSVRVSADADTGAAEAALAALAAVVGGLDGRQADVQVDADAGAAVAELAITDAAVSRLDGRTAHINVDVDAGAALAKMALVSAGLAGMGAGAAVAAGVAATVAPALIGIAGVAAVAVPSLTRINDALKAQEQAGNSAARGLATATGATRNLVIEQATAQIKTLQAAQAADQLSSAQDRVKSAVAGVADAQARLKQAVQSAASAQVAAAQRAAAAERSLADAQRQAIKAQQDLNKARQQAIKDLQAITRSLQSNALDQREATLDVADAEQELAAAQKGGNSEAIERASIAYERAKLRVEELRAEQERLNTEQAKGVENNDRVLSAKEAVESANARVIDQERALAQAYAESGKAGEEAAQRVADARKALADAEKRVDDAKRAVEGVKRQQKIAALQEKIRAQQAKDQAKAAALAARQSAQTTGQKAPDLSPAEKAAAKSLQAFQKTYEKFQKDLGASVLPVITGGLKVVEKLFKPMTPLIKATAGALVTLEKSAAKALGGKFWTDFFKLLTTTAPGAVGGLGKILGDLVVTIAGIIQAALPLVPTILRVIGVITGGFASLAKGLSGDQGFAAIISIVKTAFTILVAYWQNVLGPVLLWLWQNVVTPALQGIAAAVSWAWESVIQPAVTALVAYWQNVLGPAINWLWVTVIKPAFTALGQFIAYAWTTWIQPALKALWTFITQTLAPKVLWFHENVVKPVFTKVGEAIRFAWTSVIQPALKAIWSFITETLGPKVLWFQKTIVEPVFKAVGAAIAVAWEKVIKPAFSALWTFITETLPNGFKKGVEFIGKFWDGLKAVAKAPINFIIGTVYNGGIVKVWNAVADALGIKAKLAAIPELATGGILPGYTPGRDVGIAAVSGGEAVMRPEWTRAVGSDFVHQANAAARSGGISGAANFMQNRFVGGFAGGGIIGDILATGVRKGAEAFLNPLLDKAASAMGDSQWAKMLVAWPKKMVADVIGFLEKKEAAQGGAGAGKALQFARGQIGKDYQWGATGPNTFDCSGLTMRAWQAGGRKDIPRTSQQQMGWVQKVAKPVPGALGFPHPGHVWMYSSPNTIVEAPQTGLKVREVAARAASVIGVPPGKFDDGGYLPTGHSLVYNGTGSPEPVLTDQQWRSMQGATQGGDSPALNIENFNATPEQSPQQIAQELSWLSRSR